MLHVFFKENPFTIVIILVFSLFFCPGVRGEEIKSFPITGQKYYRNYTYLEYDHLPQNFCIIQDTRGIIYAANQGGVLIFDGTTWELANIPYITIRSLTLGKDRNIYLGGKDIFGYLTPNKQGFLEFVTLKPYFDSRYGPVPEIIDVAASREGVYFRGKKVVFRWNFNKIDFYREGSYGPLYSCDGSLIIQQGKIGLLNINNTSFTPIEGTGSLASERIWMLAPYNSKDGSRSLLIGTNSNGLLLYKNGSLTPFKTGADEYLKENNITHGIRLSNGQYAIATRKGGMVILNAEGKVNYIFNKANGLQDNDVNWITEDNLGNTWLALGRGISRLEYRSPFYMYDGRIGLDGQVLTAASFKNSLYAGTTQGIFVLHPGAGSFELIPKTGLCRVLLSAGNSFLAATDDGVFCLDTPDRLPQPIIQGVQMYGLIQSKRFPGYAWCASRKGLFALALKNNSWAVQYTYNEIKNDLRNIVEDRAGNLWLHTFEGEILKVNFPARIDSPVTSRYRKKKGVYEGDLFLAVIRGHTLFTSPKGVSRYDEKKDTFIPDFILGDDYAYRGENGEGKPVFRIAEDLNHTVWFHSGSKNYRAVLSYDNKPVIDCRPFLRIPVMQVNGIFPDPDGKNIWFAGTEGLIRYDTEIDLKWKKEFSAVIKKVIVNDTISAYGSFFNTIAGKNTTQRPEFLFNRRNIGFQCGAPFFEQESAVLFRYKLVGYTGEWTSWVKESKKQYTNLEPGEYTFFVQAKNIYEVESKEDAFSFRVLPPFYRTWWAYGLYGIALVFLFNFAVKWRSRKIVREKERLEQVVEERTVEIREKNVQLQYQSEKLKEMDEIKSRFFANISHEFRTPLTLIMSPLEQMLARKPDAFHKRSYQVMHRNAQQLLTFINRLLELARIDSGRMNLQAVYADIVMFLKQIVIAFEEMAAYKKISLKAVYPVETLFMYFDHEKMEEVMYNLLSNAVKFTPVGGTITLSLSVESTFVSLSVKDTGIGIPVEQMPYVFDRFFHARQADSASHRGTGIGLSLTKELVLLHHGEIHVESEEHKGTEFIIRLPLGKDHLAASEVAAIPVSGECRNRFDWYSHIPEQIVGEEEESLSEEQKIPGSIDEEGKENDEELREKISILVVEDHEDMRGHIRQMLEPVYQVYEAVDGEAGMEKAKETMPDLIISDIMMPKMDGYELCRVLKKEIRTSHIPVILLTARASEGSVLRGYETKADDYITKPFNEKMLKVRIRNLVDLRRQMQLKIQRERMLLPSEIAVSNQDDLLLKEFKAVIDKNLSDEDFNIDVICEKLFISRSTLFRKIQVLTGETPNQFILSYRLERGARMLRENFGNVTEVAMAVGFSTPQYFAKCFRDRFHCTPRAYRESEIK